jgi:hypothetical protein
MKYSDVRERLANNVGTKIEKELPSFYLYKDQNDDYIQPELRTYFGVDADESRIILITAAGATGKTALAQQLSYMNQIPIFDLSIHDPVGSKSLSGVLTEAFTYNKVGEIISKMERGEYSIIVEALDEGRLKTNENSIDAFLKDIAEIASKSIGVPFVILGRNQIIEQTWFKLEELGIKTLVLEIDVFTKEQAIQFIDQRVNDNPESAKMIQSFRIQYVELRDFIINTLGKFFRDSESNDLNAYERFIGYAPVLIAISILLTKEKNFHKLYESFTKKDYNEKELELIFDIIYLMMDREKNEKVDAQYVPLLMKGFESTVEVDEKNKCYNREEQAVRLLQSACGIDQHYRVFSNIEIQKKHDDEIRIWLDTHPFEYGNKFQNVIFEAYCIASLMYSKDQEIIKLVDLYIKQKYKYNHLLFIFFRNINKDNHSVNRAFMPALINSLKTIDSKDIKTEITIDGTDPADVETGSLMEPVDIEIYTNYNGNEDSIYYETMVKNDDLISFYGFLRDISIILPCDVEIASKNGNISIGPSVFVRANDVVINGNTLNIGSSAKRSQVDDDGVYIDCRNIMFSTLETVNPYLELEIITESDVFYPLNRYKKLPGNREIKISRDIEEKYKRFRRIVMTLRSHSKGSLARYRYKIEHQRVLKNNGRKILDRMCEDNILVLKRDFYHWDPEKASILLGISWHDLRNGRYNQRVLEYLDRIRG